ncbi:MAG: hypothetical protein U0234_28100 [Sandaracinus sp.]
MRALAPIALFVLSLAVLGAPPSARAGDRQLELTLVDVSPRGTPGSSACMAAVSAEIRQDYVDLRPMTQARLLRTLGLATGSDYTTWTSAAFNDAEGYPRITESVALVDCRPDERRVTVRVFPPNDHAAQIDLRDVELDDAHQHWVGTLVLSLAWMGFSP